MSVQQEIRAEDRPVLQAPRPDEQPPRPVGREQPTVVLRGAGRGTTAVAAFALLAGLGALVVPVGAPLVELVYPDHPVVKALTQNGRALREAQQALATTNERLAGQTARIEAIEASLGSAAERISRLELGGKPAVPPAPLATAPADAAPAAPADATAADAPTTEEGRLGTLESHVNDLAARLGAMEPAVAIATKRIDTLDTLGSNGKTFSQRMDGVEAKMAETVAAVTDMGAQNKATGEQLAAVAPRFDEVAARQAAAEALITGIGQRLGTIEAAAATANGSHAALRLSVAILQLNNVVQTHRPFVRELAAVTKLWQRTPVNGELEVLTAHAERGVATVAELRDSFSVILAPKLRTLAEGGDRGFVDRMRGWVSSWIAPAAPQTAVANPVDLVVDATIEKLAEEDVRGAVDHLSRLDGAPATLATRWVVEAKSRIAIDRAMDTLLSMGLEDLGRTN